MPEPKFGGEKVTKKAVKKGKEKEEQRPTPQELLQEKLLEKKELLTKSDQIEMEQLSKKLDLMYGQGETKYRDLDDLERSYERILGDKEKAARVLYDLPSLEKKYAEEHGTIGVNKEGKVFRSAASSVRLFREAVETQKETKNLRNEIRTLENEIETIKNKKFKIFDKKKWKKKLTKLEEARKAKENEWHKRTLEIMSELEEKQSTEFLDVSGLLGSFDSTSNPLSEQKEFAKVVEQGGMSFPGLLERIKKALKEVQERKLSPAEQEIYDKYREIKKRTEKE